jgi:hypothetical protein
MTATPGHRMNGHAAARGEGGELCVVVECHGFVCALGVGCVTRLALPDVVTGLDGKPDGRVVDVEGEKFAAWDLGLLFGLRPLGSAWILLDVPWRGGAVPIALRTGQCLVVDRVRPQASLPAAAFRARGRAFLGAFDAAAFVTGKVDTGTFGVLVDPTSLLDDAELAASKAAVAAAASSRGGG